MKRPELNSSISVTDFKGFYWLKKELIAFCKSKGITATGGKPEIAGRIITYLQTGKVIKSVNRTKYVSKFDWNTAVIGLDTIITDNYKNTENARAFLKNEIGPHFRFNVPFLAWMKQNVGKTMGDAIAEWKRIYELKRGKNYKTEIASQFEYNTYIRSFLAGNPGKTMPDAIHYWNLKRNQRGNTAYSPEDLLLEDE